MIWPFRSKSDIALRPLGMPMPLAFAVQACVGGMAMIVRAAPFSVWQMPSMAANLTGWLACTSRVWRSPVPNMAPAPRNATTTLSRSANFVTSP